MSWREITIGSFLKERPDRIKPDQANPLGLKRIKKIDFSGNIYLADNTRTRTNMILVKPGDLVISGINVEKGALAVYEGTEDVLATIHYSSYEFDKSIIDIEYLKWFLTSNIFMNILNEQVGGGIKTELKPKKFLPLKIKLPDINLQREIAKKINSVANEIEVLKETNKENYELISKFRKSILQEAVQGKLVPQDPNDEPASVLLERIREEKERLIKEGKIKKAKPLPSITEDEIPYELPDGWEWVRLGDAALLERGKSKHRPRNDESLFVNGTYPFIQTGDVANCNAKRIIDCYSKCYNEKGLKQSRLWPKGTLCITIAANIAETGILGFDACFPDSVVGLVPFYPISDVNFFDFFFRAFKNDLIRLAPATAQKNINLNILNTIIFPLPPLNEQKRIVEKVDQLMALCDELERNIEQSKKDSELLMQSVLQEAFREAI